MDSMVGRHRKSTPHPQLLALRCRYDSVWKEGGGAILPTMEGKKRRGGFQGDYSWSRSTACINQGEVCGCPHKTKVMLVFYYANGRNSKPWIVGKFLNLIFSSYGCPVCLPM